MKTELTEVSPTRKEIKIEIEPEIVREAYNKVSKKYANAAQVPGFRKGNAPVDVVRLRFKDEIRSETLQELLSDRVAKAIQEHELSPLAEPHLHLENAETLKLNGSQPVTLHVHVEVMPEIPTPEYKGLEVTRRVRPRQEGELDSIIDERRQEFASLIPVEDRKSQEGDTVIVDLEGTFADEPDSEPIKADDLEIKLGDEMIEKSFTENLLGVGEDEEKEFTVSYPEEFSSPALAGKTVTYKAKIKSVGRVELPELNDEWAQSLDEDFESLEDLRGKLQEDLESVAKADADARVRNDLIAKLIENHEFEIPNAMIDIQARNLLNNFAQDLSQRGVDLNKVEKDFVQIAYNQMRGQAERDVRGAMLLEKIAELENVEVSANEVDEEIERMADYYRTTPEEIRASLAQQQGGEENIANSLRTRKSIEALVEKAKITDGEWIDETQPQVQTEAETEEKSENSEDKKFKKEEKSKEKKPKAEKKEIKGKETKKKSAKKE
ncbi:MAG: trigger factor [Acidobacteria bacterium]|jgi:trigger factor|nr:trigger factor [Acidobacteriota bacterium]